MQIQTRLFWKRHLSAKPISPPFYFMIVSFNHKGLELFFKTGDSRLILSNPSHVEKIYQILTFLNISSSLDILRLPEFRLHKLKGKLKGYYAVKVNANWRIVFQFDEGKVYNVDLIDYH